MGIISGLFKTATLGAVAAGGTFYVATFRSTFVPFDPSDPILSSSAFKKYNPDNNPPTKDLCIRKVPLSKIDPELLEKDGKLVEAFCGGVWSGLGSSMWLWIHASSTTAFKQANTDISDGT